MTEPLHPDLRQELKRAHRGLQDSEIDALEELIAKRFTLDPARDVEALEAIEQEKEALLNRAMPHYHEVVQRFRAEREERPPRPNIRIQRKDAPL